MEEEREGWMWGKGRWEGRQGGGRNRGKIILVQENSAQLVMHRESSPVLLLEHWMPAKDVEEKEQLSETVKVHMLSLVSVASLQTKFLTMRWPKTALEMLQESRAIVDHKQVSYHTEL